MINSTDKVQVYESAEALWKSAQFESERAHAKVEMDDRDARGTVIHCVHAVGRNYAVPALTQPNALLHAQEILDNSDRYQMSVGIEVIRLLKTIAAQIIGTFASNERKHVQLEPAATNEALAMAAA